MILARRFSLKDTRSRRVRKKRVGKVNFIWHANEITFRRWQESRQKTSKGDLHRLTQGLSEFCEINPQRVRSTAYKYKKHSGQVKRIFIIDM